MDNHRLNIGNRGYSRGVTPDQLARITIDPSVCAGKPCIRGMRIRVCDVLDMLGSDMSVEQVLEAFPDLERADILAALAYASRLTDSAAA
jgi:uncharacterized protein (DUF433 family)